MKRIRIWDEGTGALVGEVESWGDLNLIWFAPSFSTLMTESQPGHYTIALKPIDRGRCLMTHSYLGIPSLPYGGEKDKEPDQTR